MGGNLTTHFTSLRLAPCCKGMAKQVKSGYMLRFKKRLFGKDWREEYVVLYSDSTLAWFRERDRLEPDGGVVIREAPHLIAIAQWTSRIPNRPELPPGRTQATLLAFGSKNKDKVHWFLCRDESELSDWMMAISNTLPPPPFPPTASPLSGQEDDQSTNNLQYKVAPPPPLPHGYLPPPPPYSDNRHYVNPIGLRTVAPPPSIQQANMAPPHNNTTTVLIRDGGRAGAGSHMDGFATGLLMGNMLNTGPTWGWGLGWGWGGHYGHSWGGGVGFYNNDSDIHINNHTQINNYSHYDNRNIGNDFNVNDADVTMAGDCHGSVVGGLGMDVIGDDDYDMLGAYDGGLGGDAFDAGCDFAF